MSMRPGLLRHRINVDEMVSSRDSSGGVREGWVTRATVWGSIEPLRGREALTAAQLLADMDTRIILRWAPIISGITEKWRLRYQSIVYNIISIANVDMRNEKLEIYCRSGKNVGA